MAGLIPQHFIDDLLDRCDIVDIIDSRVKLKKSGKNYSACCPFHDEKTPSFTVSPDKQFYYCFGCGASGNALGFVMEYERLDFPEAVESIAKTVGLEVPREQRNPEAEKREKTRRDIFQLLEKADQFYQQQLRHHPHREQAINYLKQRGLNGLTARDYNIGFAPPGWDNLLKALGESSSDQRVLNEAGLLIQQVEKQKIYDRFRHRIMFPIRDLRGRVIGFGGRVLGDDKPKYLNSPETPVFHKRKELYGLYEARQQHNQIPRLLVVEGYMDVVSLAQFGITYAVATLGTACGEDHLNQAFKHTSEIVFCFDGDRAGRNAAKRALENALPVMTDGRQIKFLFLPENEDPDTLVRQIGAEKFTVKIDQAVPLEDFFFDSLAEDVDIQTMEGRARLSKLAAPQLNRLPKGVYRELMLENLASRTGLGKDTLLDLTALPAEPIAAPAEPTVETTIEPANEPPAEYQSPAASIMASFDEEPAAPQEDYSAYESTLTEEDTPAPPARYRLSPVQKLLALMLNHPEHASELQDINTLEGDSSELKLLRQLYSLLEERPHYKLHHILGHWKGTHNEQAMRKLANIASNDLIQASKHINLNRKEDDESEPYNAQTAMSDCLGALKKHKQEQVSSESLAKLKNTRFTDLSKEERLLLVRNALKK